MECHCAPCNNKHLEICSTMKVLNFRVYSFIYYIQGSTSQINFKQSNIFIYLLKHINSTESLGIVIMFQFIFIILNIAPLPISRRKTKWKKNIQAEIVVCYLNNFFLSNRIFGLFYFTNQHWGGKTQDTFLNTHLAIFTLCKQK